jgi:organic radical activating enzyme
MSQSVRFQPDFIVEATSVCDRACVGCYAPNFVSKKSATAIYQDRAELFLSPIKAETALLEFSEKFFDVLSIRGGEPSLHPELSVILKACEKRAKSVVLETHGRWLETPNDYHDLIDMVVATGTGIKLSFDQMHGLTPSQLRSISEFLDEKSIPLYVAITEASESDFLKTRTLCSWVPDEQIIFQEKVFSGHQLVRPIHGVLGIDAQIRRQLHTKFTSENEQRGLAV